MTTQPEALLLADWLEEQYDPTGNQDRAAAELRRLQTENEAQAALLRQAMEALENASDVFSAPEDLLSADVDLVLEATAAIRQHLEDKQ